MDHETVRNFKANKFMGIEQNSNVKMFIAGVEA